MATTNTERLTMVFGLQSGGQRSIGISFPKSGLTAAETKTAMDAIVTYGAAFDDPITSAKEAELKATTTTKLVEDGAAVADAAE